jgi:urease accessory protein
MQTLAGHLELVCSLDSEKRSYISRQSFCAPYHISKPYQAEHALVVQVVNPTAGLFSGDRLESCIHVERGARLLLSTPSASRAHTMHSGRAELAQTFHVAEGAWLEYSPAPLIPQRASEIRQTTQVRLDAGGEMFFLEILAPGRVARGECFEFSKVDWDFSLFHDGRLIAAERFILRPGDESLTALRSPFSAGYYASGYLVTSRIPLEDECWENIRALNSKDVLVGTSRLSQGGWGIRILARESVAMQKTIAHLRRSLSVRLPELGTQVRKI